MGSSDAGRRMVARHRSVSRFNGGTELPVNAIALVEHAVKRAESDILATARADGAKSERYIFLADCFLADCLLNWGTNWLNPFVEGIAIAGEFWHGDGGKTSVQKFVVGIDALWVEIFGSEFACEHQRPVHNGGQRGVIRHGLQMQAHGQLYIHAVAIFPGAVNFRVAGGFQLLFGLERLAVEGKARAVGPVRNAYVQGEASGRFCLNEQSSAGFVGKASFLPQDDTSFPPIHFRSEK